MQQHARQLCNVAVPLASQQDFGLSRPRDFRRIEQPASSFLHHSKDPELPAHHLPTKAHSTSRKPSRNRNLHNTETDRLDRQFPLVAVPGIVTWLLRTSRHREVAESLESMFQRHLFSLPTSIRNSKRCSPRCYGSLSYARFRRCVCLSRFQPVPDIELKMLD